MSILSLAESSSTTFSRRVPPVSPIRRRARKSRYHRWCFVCQVPHRGPKVFVKKALNIFVHLGWCAEQLYRESKVCDRSLRGRRRRALEILTRIEAVHPPVTTNGHQANGAPA
jgi:hypothetical protein